MSLDDNKIVSSSSVSTHISNGEIDKANSMIEELSLEKLNRK